MNADGEKAVEVQKCRACDSVKSLREYYQDKAGKYRMTCKSCVLEKCKRWRDANKERRATAQRAYRQRNREQISQKSSAWAARNRGKVNEYQRQYKAKNKEAYKAWWTIWHALEHGHIIRPDACQQCGATGCRIEASHDDYTKPLAVEWLCPQCHRTKDYAIRITAHLGGEQ